MSTHRWLLLGALVSVAPQVCSCNGGASPSGGAAGSTATGSSGAPGGGGNPLPGTAATGGAAGAGGVAMGTGGVPEGGHAGTAGSGGRNATGAAGTGGLAAGGAGTGGDHAAALAFGDVAAIITGVRGVTSGPATAPTDLLNPGSAPLTVSLAVAAVDQVGATLAPTTQDAALTAFGAGSAPFRVDVPSQLPATVGAGADLAVTVGLSTAVSGLPAAPPQDSGATLLTATLTATAGAASTQAKVYGLVLTQALWEPTLGQILFTLGYKLNVGLAQNNANPNRGKTVQQLPGVEPGTDEIAAPLFVKSGTAAVTLTPVARFSPMGPLPFGWYPSGTPATRHVVGTMAEVTDPQTSNKSRMVLPPLAAGSASSFDPGTQVFGVWVYTDELTQKYDSGTAANGDYAYGQDSLNAPAGVHRFKVYPLKDAGGTAVANSFLMAVEEASNGDYQDYVFVLANAKVAP